MSMLMFYANIFVLIWSCGVYSVFGALYAKFLVNEEKLYIRQITVTVALSVTTLNYEVYDDYRSN